MSLSTKAVCVHIAYLKLISILGLHVVIVELIHRCCALVRYCLLRVCWIARLAYPCGYVPYPSMIHALCALPIINTRLCTYEPLPSSIGALRAFILSCVVLLQLKGKFYECGTINYTHPSLYPLFLVIWSCLFFTVFTTAGFQWIKNVSIC